MNPRQAFPHLPKDVFDSWIQPAVDRYGWMFSEHRKETKGTPYQNLLLGEPLDFWMRQTFGEINLSLESLEFNQATENAVEGIRIGSPEWIAKLPDSPDRLGRLTEFIRTHNKIPIPIIVMMDVTCFRLQIVDGIHRMAAIRSLNDIGFTHIPALIIGGNRM